MALKRNIPILLFTNFPDSQESFYDAILHTNSLINESCVQNYSSKIIADHIVYDKELFRNIMPKSTVYVSSLRNPPDQLKSMFHYFDLASFLQLKSEDPVSEFLRNINSHSDEQNWPRGIRIRNKNAVSLGVENTSETDMDKALEDFQMMLLTEYMDESLVLLGRKMCWDISDILYLSANVRSYSYKRTSIDPKLLRFHQIWSPVDYELYDRYNKSLWDKLLIQDPDFWDELDFYKKQQIRAQNFCRPLLSRIKNDISKVEDILDGGDAIEINIPKSQWGESFKVNVTWCILNKLRQLALRNILRVKQYPQLCNYVDFGNASPYMYEFEIDETREVVTLHPSYCKNSHPDLGFPLEILHQRTAYLWTD